MSDTVLIRNISPFGALDLPLVGRIIGYGETFELPADLAGRPPTVIPSTDPDVADTVDLGEGLLEQSFNYIPAAAPWTPILGLIDPDTTVPELVDLLKPAKPAKGPKAES